MNRFRAPLEERYPDRHARAAREFRRSFRRSLPRLREAPVDPQSICKQFNNQEKENDQDDMFERREDRQRRQRRLRCSGAREALEQAPEAAQFKWRASCEWVTGTHSRSVIGNFFGLGAEQSRDKNFRVEADHPKVFASEDNAPTPVEIVLSGLASCLTAGVAAVAQRRGIQLHSVKATLEGDMDIQGILGMDDDVRNGFGGIRVHFDIRADASQDDIKSLVAQSQKRSAVFDIVTNPTNVFVTVN